MKLRFTAVAILLFLLGTLVPSTALAADVAVTTNSPMFLIFPTPSDSVAVGESIYFMALANNLLEPISYTVDDSFSGSTAPVGDITISNYGEFSWTPTSSDSGSHTLTITARDGVNTPDTATMTLVITGSGTSTDTLPPVISDTPTNTTPTATSSLENDGETPTDTSGDETESISTTPPVRVEFGTPQYRGGHHGSGQLATSTATSTTLVFDAHELFLIRMKLEIAMVLAKLMRIEVILIEKTQVGN